MEIKNLVNKKNIAFHCDTEEKAIEFIKKAHELGYKWIGEDIEINKGKNITYYDDCYSNTCYCLMEWKCITFDEIAFFKNHNYKIIEYELDER